MNVTCGGCGATYRVDPAKVPVDGVRARCSACDHVFWVRRPAVEAAPVATVAAVSVPVTPPAAPVTVSPPSPMPPVVASAPAAAERPAAAPMTSEPPSPASLTTGFTAPVAPAFARPAFGAAPLRNSSVMPPAARDLMPPPADALRVAMPEPVPTEPDAAPEPERPAPEPVSAPTSERSAPDEAPMTMAPPARLAVPEPPPVVASAAVSALGGILPPGGFEAPPPRPAAPVLPRPAGTRPVNPFLQQDPAARARRLARALVSDMVTYHPGKKAEGLRDGTLQQLFEEEIRKSWEEYAEQVGRDNPETSVRFREALNEILADGRPIF